MSKKITLTVDVQAEMSNLQDQVGKMQKLLGGLKLGDNLKAQTNQTINSLMERIKKVREYTENNTLDLVDEKKVHAEFNGIKKDFNSLVTKLNANAKNIKLVDNKAFSAIEAAFDVYKKKIAEVDGELKQHIENQKRLQNEIQKIKDEKNVGNLDKEEKRAHKVLNDLQAERRALNAKKKEYIKEAEESGRTKPQAEASWNQKKIDGESVVAMADRLNKEIKVAEQSWNKAKKARNEANEAFVEASKDVQKSLDEENSKVSELTAKLDTVKGTAFADLKKTLVDLSKQGLDLGFDPEKLKSIDELKKNLKDISKQDLDRLLKVLDEAGVVGRDAADGIDRTDEALTRCTEEAKEFDKTLDNFKDKAKYFFGIENAINLLKRAVRSAFNTVKELDEVMTETAVVTSFDVGDMWDQLPQYTQRANELGVSIHDAYKAATLYYQQGLKTNEVMAVSNETLKMARIANLDAADATSRMTNALRGFNMEINETSAQRVNDVYSELAAITASDTKEISTAMTKVASLAHNANMEFETTSAFLAQMIETTRESAETAGTALKTVIARFSEVKKLYSQGDLMGTDEEGEEIDVNKVSQALRSAGINMNEYLTGAKGLDDIFIELASKWDSLDMIQQRYIATMAAGSRQQSRFIAMMSDYKRTTELVAAANNSAGASQRQFNKTLESFQSKLAKLKNSWDTFLMGIADNEIIKGAIDILTNLLDSINKLTEGLDGIPGSLARIGIALGGLKIGKEISTQVLGEIIKIRNQAGKVADGTAQTFAQRFKNSFGKIGSFFNVDSTAFQEMRVPGSGYGKIIEGLQGAKFSSGKGLSELQKRIVSTQVLNDAIKEETILEAKNAEEITKTIKVTDAQSLAARMEASSMLQFVGVMGLASVALGLLFAALKRANDQWGIFKSASQMANEELERAEETADNASKAANEATEAYNDLRNSLDSIGDKYENIEKMTRGTQEWRDAVLEVNNEVLKLSEKYKDLEFTQENGVLKIANEKEVKDKQYQYSINAQAAAMGAKAQISGAREGVARARFSELYTRKGNWTFDEIREGLAGAVGTADYDIFKVFGKNAAKNIASGDFGDNEELKKAYEEWQKSMEEARKATEQYNNSLAALAVSNADLVKGTEKESSNFMNANRMDSLVTDAFNEIFKEGLNTTQMKEEIAQESGYMSYGAYEKENGSISDEAAQQMLAEIRARKKATQSIELFSKKINTSLPGMEALKKIYSREDLAGLTKEDIEKLFNGVFDLDKFKASDKEGQLTMLGQVQIEADKIWTAMPDDLKEAFGNQEDFRRDVLLAVERSAIGTDQGIERANRISSTGASSVFNQLSGGAASDLSKNFEEIFRVSGRAGVDAIQKDIDKITNGMDQGEVQKFVNIINSIDWKNANDVEGLQGLLEEVGITDVNVDDLTNHIIDLGNASKNVDFEKLTEQLKGMASFAQRIRSGEQGATGIKEEDMKNAVAAGIDPNLFVAELGKDTYTYIGDSILELADSLEEGIVKAIDTKNIQERIDNANKFNGLDSGSVVREDITSVGRFLSNYIRAGGTGINAEAVAMYGGQGNLEELLKLYDAIQKNAEELGKNTEALKTQSEYEALSNDPSKNAELYAETGDDIYKRALLSQATQAGISEDLRKRSSSDNLASLTDIFNKAKGMDFDTTELENHMQALQKYAKAVGDEMSDTLAAQTALANARMVRGMKNLSSTYDDWSKYIDKDNKLMKQLDADGQKAVNDMKNSLKDILDINEDLPDSFFEDSENIKLIQDAVNDVDGAVDQLKINASRSLISLKVGADTTEANQDIIDFENWLLGQYPTLKVGSEMDIGPINKALEVLKANGIATAKEVEAYFSSLDIKFDAEYDEEIVGWTPKIVNNMQVGYDPIKTKTVKRITAARYKGSKPIDYTPPKTSGGGGGSGSGKEDKPDYWENPFDELYNLQEKINESIRTREALERKYQKTVKLTESRLGEVTKAYADQIKQLRAEADLEKQMQEGRARQLNNIGNEIYTDSEGNRATFASLGVMKYASYDQNTGVITIDWPALEEIASDPNRTKEGEAAEAYIKRLEELQTQFEEVRDKLWDIEDKIEELREEAIDNYLTFEDRVMEALVNSYQQEIDDFKELSDTIKSTTDDVIKNIQEDVALARQIRDNTKKEEDIAEMEARLAYLRRDTSGANDLEIKQLEEELNQARQDYSDDLIDQQIQQMQDEAEKAAEQREHQIDLMQHSLDMAIKNGDLWEEVYGLIDSSVNEDGSIKADSELMKLLKEGESFQSLSLIGQKKWMDEVAQAIKEALVGLGEAEDKWNIGDNDRRTGVSLDTFVERLYKEVLGRDADEAGKKYWVEQLQSGKLSRADVLKSFLGSEEFSKKNMGDEDFVETLYKTFFGRASDAEGKSYWTGQLKSGAKTRDDLINEFLKSTEWINSFMPKPGTGTKKPIGGGTSWADDTEKLPTMLDRKESENLVVLKDILGNLLNVSGGDAVKSNGDTYFDIHIDAEIGSDYDVDQLVERIKKQIYDTSAYRNANVINYIR